jgi:hypothetical protein
LYNPSGIWSRTGRNGAYDVTEPAASTANVLGASLTGGAVVLFGPGLGPWVSVAFAAVIGSLWSVGLADTSNRSHALTLMLRTVLTACVLTGAVAFVATQYTAMPTDYLLPATAFGIAAWFDNVRQSITDMINRKLGGHGE